MKTKKKKKVRYLLLGLLAGQAIRLLKKKKQTTPVYFISGMCYNCSVFDDLELPSGFIKKYVEWHIPHPEESLQEYTLKMAREIDTRKPFILVGYSFGAVIMQEMNRFLKPEKSIIISSFKHPKEIPSLFQFVRTTHLAEWMPDLVYSSTDFITNAFNHLIYHSSNEELIKFMTYTEPAYIKWAVTQITAWSPDNSTEHLYHIHGTADQIFPFKQLKHVFPIEGGDHLMVFKKAKEVSAVLSSILLIKER